jgi:hypothetical protein
METENVVYWSSSGQGKGEYTRTSNEPIVYVQAGELIMMAFAWCIIEDN